MSQDIATLGLRVDSSQLVDLDRRLRTLEDTAGRTEEATTKLGKSTDFLTRLYRDLAAAAAAVKLFEYIKDAALLNARYETLGVTMGVVGKQAGYTAVQMEAAAVALQKTGISMIESRQQAMRLVQAHIDLSNATKLARIAQDAAVIGNMNSSDAFAALVHGIQSGQTEVLRTIGLNVNMEQSYKAIAATLHKTVGQLTQNEKTQGILNAVMAAGSDIAGVYAASMDTAGKQLLSLKRYTEDLKVIQGEVFNEVLTVAVMAYTAHLKDANGEVSALAQNGQLKEWGADITDVFVWVADNLQNMLGAVKLLSTGLAAGAVAIGNAFTYLGSIKDAGLDLDKQKAAWASYVAAQSSNAAQFAASRDEILAGEDKFAKALGERRAAVADKAAKELKATEDREKQLQNIMVYYAGQREKGLVSEAQYLKAVAATMQSFTGDNHKYADTAAGPDTKAASAAAKAAKTYKDLIGAIEGKTAASALDDQMTGKLTAGQKYSLEVMDDLRTGALKLTDTEKKSLGVKLEAMLTQERLTTARDADVKAQADAAEKSGKETTAVWDQVRAMQSQVELYGLSATAALNLEAVRLQAALNTPELTALELSALEQRLAAVRALSIATQELDSKNFIKKQADDARQTWQKTADMIENALTTALMNGFGSGKSAAVVLRDSIVAMFKTLILQPTVKAIAQAGAGAAGSLLTSAASAGNASSLLGSVGTAGGLYSAYTSSSLGQFMSGFSGSAGAASEALGAPMTGAAQAGSYAAAAAPYLAAAGGGLAAYGVGERIGGAGGAVAGAAAGAGTIALGGAITGAAAGTGVAAGAMTALAAIPVWGWAAIGALAILGSMQDGPEKATRLGFGSNNAAGAISINERGNEGKSNQYVADTSSTGAFGSFGVVSTFWMEAAQPAVQAFVKTVTQTDDALAKFMNGTEKAATVAALSAHTYTSNSGAEGSDPNGQGGLDATFRDRIQTIMQAVDPALGKLLDGFTGTSQALAAEAEALLDYRKNLPAVSESLFGVVVTVQDLVALRTPTEAMGAALIRITSAFQATNAVADALGVKVETAFGSLGLASLDARQKLIDLAGGVDALGAGTTYFAQNFMTAADRLSPVFEAVTRRMGDLGYAGVTTADGYRDAVLNLAKSGALATEAGASTYIELLKLAPSFKMVGDAAAEAAKATADAAKIAADAATQATKDAAEARQTAADAVLGQVDSAYSALETIIGREKAAKQKAHEIAMAGIEAQITASQTAVTKSKTLSDTLHNALDGLKGPQDARSDRTGAQAQVAAMLAIARAGGPLPTVEALKAPLATLQQDSKDLFATYQDYQRDFYTTANDVAALSSAADASLSTDEKALAALEAQKKIMEQAYAAEIAALDATLDNAKRQVDLLKGMDLSLITVTSALATLNATIGAAMQNKDVAATSGIAGAYNTALGRTPDAAGMSFWQGQVNSGSSVGDVVSAISNSPEAKVQALYKSTLGRSADMGGLQFWMQQMQNGASESQIREALTQSAEYQSTPHFAAGGQHSGGWRVVGEHGPELENTGASTIVSNGGARALLDQSAVAAEIRAMREEMRTGLMTIARHTGTVAKLQEQFDRDGTPQPRNEGATV